MTTLTSNTAILDTPPGAHPAVREEYNYDHFHPRLFLGLCHLERVSVGAGRT